MKKVTAQKQTFLWVMLAVVAAFSLTGCGQEEKQLDSRNQIQSSEPTADVTDNAADNTEEPDSGQEDTSPEKKTSKKNGSVVYMTTDISSKGLMAVYKKLEASPDGKIAVKLSTGENGSNYLRTDLIGELVKSLDATIVECNTAYGGERANTEMHYQLAKDHGYTDIADVDIMDEDGSMTLPVSDGDNLKENYVGKSR